MVKLTSQDLEGKERERRRREGEEGGVTKSLKGDQQPSVFANSKPEPGRHVHVEHLLQE